MDKYFRYIPPLALIIFGASLEIFYYWFRFIGDGVNPIIALVAGVVLTIFLVVVSRLKKSIPVLILIGLLLGYSIFCTSAGQAYSLEQIRMQQEEARSQQDDIERERTRIRNTIDVLTQRYDNIEKQKNEQITSFEERFNWKNTLAKSEESQKEIQDEIQLYRNELAKLYTTYEVQPPDIYQYYGNLFKWSPKFLQTILQMLLSGFIALMAPIGVHIWPKKKRSSSRKRKKKNKISEEQISKWVQSSWIGIRMGKTKKILPKEVYERHYEKNNWDFDSELYDNIKKYAIISGTIKNDGMITIENEEMAVNKIYTALNNRR